MCLCFCELPLLNLRLAEAQHCVIDASNPAMPKAELPLIISLLCVNAGSNLDMALFVSPCTAMDEIFGGDRDSFAAELQVSTILGTLFRRLPSDAR